jgi:hypothetical protein
MVDSGIVGFRGRRIFGYRQPVICFSAPIFPCRGDQGNSTDQSVAGCRDSPPF